MQTHTVQREIIRNNIPTETNFTIKATGKAFRILSDGLYTDKILAIVRELSCNAYDAHVAAGNPEVPFDVQLPTALDPVFRIRDYGIGLCRDDVLHLYTSYFESTKTGSNDFIGALGLGSKSPFSLVDSFIVNSHFNGVKMMFTAFITEHGIPSIAQLGEEPTDEPNGLEIIVPVENTSDFSVFQRKAAYVFRGFDVRPNVLGQPNFQVAKQKIVVEGPGWKLIDPTNEEYGSTFRSAHAIQGNVVYPISVHSIKNVPDNAMALLRLPLEIRFPIGELDVAASREALSMDSRTQANILARSQKIITELKEELVKSVAECKTAWDARLKFIGIRNISHYLASLLGTTFEYHGRTYDVNMSIKFEKHPNLTILEYRGGYIKPRQRHAPHMNTTDALGKPLATPTILGGIDFSASSDIAFWIDDVGTSATSRLQGTQRSSGTKYLFRLKETGLVSGRNEQAMTDLVKSSEDIKALIAALEGAPIRWVSEIERPAKAKTQRRLGKTYQFDSEAGLFETNYYKELIVRSNRIRKTLSESWVENPVDLNNITMPYVLLDRFQPVDLEKNSVDNFPDIFLKATRLGLLKGKNIIGIRFADGKDLPKNYELMTWLKAELTKHIKQNNLINKLRTNAQVIKDEEVIGVFREFTKAFLSKMEVNGDVAKFVKSIQTNNSVKLTEADNRIVDLAKILNLSLSFGKLDTTVETLKKQVLEHYPLLDFLAANYANYYSRKPILTEIVDYIKVVDLARTTNIT